MIDLKKKKIGMWKGRDNKRIEGIDSEGIKIKKERKKSSLKLGDDVMKDLRKEILRMNGNMINNKWKMKRIGIERIVLKISCNNKMEEMMKKGNEKGFKNGERRINRWSIKRRKWEDKNKWRVKMCNKD